MSGVKDSFLDLERHRLQLEDQIKKLQKGLQHWQTWDAEYEALKEEIDALPATSPASLAQIKGSFEGELLNQSEIDDIFGAKASKSKEQVINVLDRRIDYVTQNITSLQKQLDVAENKYAAATVISQPDATDEDGQPVTEIIEQLDDDDNVVSYQLKKPGDSLPQLEEALEKAGIKDLSEMEPQAEKKTSQSSPSQKSTKQTSNSTADDESTSHTPAKNEAPEHSASTSSSSTTKAVSFAPSTKTEDGPAPQVSRNAKRVEQIMKSAKEQETMSSENPVIPDDEDEDDAEMRRQMLAYGMGEVGAVVAELELVEGDSDEDDEEFDESDEGFEDDEDGEDKWGRSTERIVTDKYRQRMLELEKRLGVKSRFTAQEEQKAKEKDSDSDDDRIGRIVVKQTPEATSSSSSSSKPAPSKSIIKDNQTTEDTGKKGVRFASSLDIAPNDEPAAKPVKEVTEKKEPLVDPLSDIVERTGPAKPAEPKTNRKASRFKKSRGEALPNATIPSGPMDMPARFLDQDRPTAPTGPEGATIADTLVERETSTAPIRPEDDDMVQDEVAGEYQRLRKKFIHREGGFLKEDESPIKPLDESEGGPERVSRFKSARLSKQ